MPNSPNLSGKRMLIMAGGTGGHVFPGLALAKGLIEQQAEVHWLGSVTGIEQTIIAKHNIPMHAITISGFRGKNIVQQLLAPIKIVYAVWQALIILRHLKPHLVIGMGGFVAGPGGLASYLLRTPLAIHEQNAVPGMTNKWLSRLANAVFQAFPASFPSTTQAQTVGNPVRKELIHSKVRQLHQQVIHILVMGGSQGALAINQQLPALLAEYAASHTEQQFKVRHQCGQGRQQQTAHEYAQQPQPNLQVSVLEFIDDMSAAYEEADLIICRAGASTVSEVAAAALPAIFIPFPHAVDDHQTKNAEQLSETGAALLCQQSALNAEKLMPMLSHILEAQQYQVMSACAQSQAITDATQRMVNTCGALCRVK